MEDRSTLVTSMRSRSEGGDSEDGVVLRLVRSSIRLDPPVVRFESVHRARKLLPLFAAEL
jgi:hypothetical protein